MKHNSQKLRPRQQQQQQTQARQNELNLIFSPQPIINDSCNFAETSTPVNNSKKLKKQKRKKPEPSANKTIEKHKLDKAPLQYAQEDKENQLDKTPLQYAHEDKENQYPLVNKTLNSIRNRNRNRSILSNITPAPSRSNQNEPLDYDITVDQQSTSHVSENREDILNKSILTQLTPNSKNASSKRSTHVAHGRNAHVSHRQRDARVSPFDESDIDLNEAQTFENLKQSKIRSQKNQVAPIEPPISQPIQVQPVNSNFKNLLPSPTEQELGIDLNQAQNFIQPFDNKSQKISVARTSVSQPVQPVNSNFEESFPILAQKVSNIELNQGQTFNQIRSHNQAARTTTLPPPKPVNLNIKDSFSAAENHQMRQLINNKEYLIDSRIAKEILQSALKLVELNESKPNKNVMQLVPRQEELHYKTDTEMGSRKPEEVRYYVNMGTTRPEEMQHNNDVDMGNERYENDELKLRKNVQVANKDINYNQIYQDNSSVYLPVVSRPYRDLVEELESSPVKYKQVEANYIEIDQENVPQEIDKGQLAYSKPAPFFPVSNVNNNGIGSVIPEKVDNLPIVEVYDRDQLVYKQIDSTHNKINNKKGSNVHEKVDNFPILKAYNRYQSLYNPTTVNNYIHNNNNERRLKVHEKVDDSPIGKVGSCGQETHLKSTAALKVININNNEERPSLRQVDSLSIGDYDNGNQLLNNLIPQIIGKSNSYNKRNSVHEQVRDKSMGDIYKSGNLLNQPPIAPAKISKASIVNVPDQAKIDNGNQAPVPNVLTPNKVLANTSYERKSILDNGDNTTIDKLDERKSKHPIEANSPAAKISQPEINQEYSYVKSISSPISFSSEQVLINDSESVIDNQFERDPLDLLNYDNTIIFHRLNR
ncbi:unnamed protein product [Candida verbasci]|uniref:Uncharacterized protein n=1 Tax=Candida verbasci TaxID=1227364 RepID=A0A9W4TTC0_9ASCO|nr:unnamed protein product [Candida verbasci]